MKKILSYYHINYKQIWLREYLHSFGVGIGLFILSLFATHAANLYIMRIPLTPVNDVFLNILPVLDVDEFIIQMSFLLTILVIGIFSFKPKYLNFGLKAFAVFFTIRAFLISLTHLGPSPHQLVFDPSSLGYGIYNLLYNTNNDFFFSGHTGIPFLLALVIWPEKKLRIIFLLYSFIFGITVLVAHMHYSIDVFAAPFITYTIFVISQKLFAKDYKTSREV